MGLPYWGCTPPCTHAYFGPGSKWLFMLHVPHRDEAGREKFSDAGCCSATGSSAGVGREAERSSLVMQRQWTVRTATHAAAAAEAAAAAASSSTAHISRASTKSLPL